MLYFGHKKCLLRLFLGPCFYSDSIEETPSRWVINWATSERGSLSFFFIFSEGQHGRRHPSLPPASTPNTHTHCSSLNPVFSFWVYVSVVGGQIDLSSFFPGGRSGREDGKHFLLKKRPIHPLVFSSGISSLQSRVSHVTNWS